MKILSVILAVLALASCRSHQQAQLADTALSTARFISVADTTRIIFSPGNITISPSTSSETNEVTAAFYDSRKQEKGERRPQDTLTIIRHAAIADTTSTKAIFTSQPRPSAAAADITPANPPWLWLTIIAVLLLLILIPPLRKS